MNDALQQVFNKHALTVYNKLCELIIRQTEFSRKQFGSDERRGPIGPLKHMAKEILCEMLLVNRDVFDHFLRQQPTVVGFSATVRDIKEYADLYILLLDSLRRAGHNYEAMIQAALDKMTENEQREWPPFDPANVNEAVEHIKEKP